MVEPITGLLIFAGVNLTVNIVNHATRFARWLYVAFFLASESITIEGIKDRNGYVQLVYAVNELLIKNKVRGHRQVVSLTFENQEDRPVLPITGCFMEIKEKNIEIEILPA